MRLLLRINFCLPLLMLLTAMTGCRSFDYLFSQNYKEKYGIDRAPGSLEQQPDRGEAFASYDDSVEGDLSVDDPAPTNLSGTIKKLTGRGPNRRIAVQLYQEADQLYSRSVDATDNSSARDERLSAAAEKFLEAADRWPESTLEEDALLKAGECYFFKNDYVDANEVFEQLIKAHPNSRYLDRVEAMRFSIAQYWLKRQEEDPQGFWSYNFADSTRPTRNTFSSAVRVLDQIRLDDPTGKLADDATLAAGNAHFDDGNFERASDFYDDLIRTFPSSQHQFHAHYRGLIAKLETYRGPDYDGKVLDQAEKLLKKIRKQFPREADKHRQDLQRAGGIIRYEKAKRDWALAEYYDRRGHNRAARMYYSDIAREYSETPFADQAQQRLAELSGDQDEPTQYLGWLVSLFPDPDEEQLVQPQGTIRR